MYKSFFLLNKIDTQIIMEFNWEDFKNAYKNEQEARQAFVALSEKIMQLRYPDYTIKNSDDITETNTKKDHSLGKKGIIYLAKYFLDGVSNSRKGQIRKSLNDNLPYMKANKITQWVLLLPLTFTSEEESWWENWSLRIKQENGINPIVILGNHVDKFPASIPELVEKYKIDQLGFENLKAVYEAKAKAAAQEVDSDDDDLLDFGFDDSDNKVENTSETVATQTVDTKNITAETVPGTVTVKTETVEQKTVESTVEEPKTQAATIDTSSITVDSVETAAQDNKSEEKSDSDVTATTTVTTTTTTVETTETKPVIDTSKISQMIVDSAKATVAAMPAPADNESESKKTVATAATSKKEVIAEPTLDELAYTIDFKTKFEALETEKLELPETKSNNQRAVFDKRRDLSIVTNYLNDFVFGDLSQFSGNELKKKAKVYILNEQFSRGLYIFEYANHKGLIDEALQYDYQKGVDECLFQLNFKYYMIKGDLLFAQRDYINAHECYQKALELKEELKSKLTSSLEDELTYYTSSTIAITKSIEPDVKVLEANAESYLQIGDFTTAKQNFSLALDLDPNNQALLNRFDLADYLESGTTFKYKWLNWLGIFTAPWYYFRARKIDPTIKELSKAEKLRKRAIWGVVVIALIILGAALLWWLACRVVETASDDNNIRVVSTATPLSLQISKGDYYMSKISAENPHFIDSAIAAYERALRIDNTDTVAENGFQKATIERANYITRVQQDITTDSAQYFLSMRRPTEGLRLFKYKYDQNDPSKGKFGYVDTNGIVKIAPMFDFNYRTMDEQGETFYNGRAKVCLKVGQSDTVYFYIDQYGNKINE